MANLSINMTTDEFNWDMWSVLQHCYCKDTAKIQYWPEPSGCHLSDSAWKNLLAATGK